MKRNTGFKVVVITGASAGVGRATALRYAREGAAVGLLARGRDGLAAAEREIHEKGGRAVAVPIDMANFEQVMSAGKRIEQELGPIDLWINNAMVSVLSPFREMTPEEFRRVTEVSYLGVVHGTLAALRLMEQRNRGMIIQVGSALANRGIPLQSAYCGARSAINGFTESLRAELTHDKSNIRLCQVQLPSVNASRLSWVKGRGRNIMPSPPAYQPELAAKAVSWASHHDKREVFVGLSTLKALWSDKLSSQFGTAAIFDSEPSNEESTETSDGGLLRFAPVWLMVGAAAVIGWILNRKLSRALRD